MEDPKAMKTAEAETAKGGADPVVNAAKEKAALKRRLKKIFVTILSIVIALTMLVVPAFAWFSIMRLLGAYIPISKPESLYIGAGHREFDPVNKVFLDDHFEDIRYLYFNGIDVNEEATYYDYVFCIFGKAVSGYKLQLAYTTNNQFTYQIFRATESQVASAGAVVYTTHAATPGTYYYSVNGAALAGNFLNDQTVNGELLADATEHTATYGSYSNLDKYAEPLYWQTTGVEPGNYRGDFINYYILRVNLNGKSQNDRETDVICIAARSASAS